MERNPLNQNSAEVPTDGATDSKEKLGQKKESKTSPAESPRKKQAERRIAQSIESLIERPKVEAPAKQPERPAPEETAPEPVETIHDDEQQHIERTVASERLIEHRQVDEETATELAPATDFLERVSQGMPVEQAYHEAAEAHGIELNEVPEEVGSEDESQINPERQPDAGTATESEPLDLSDEASVTVRGAGSVPPRTPAVFAAAHQPPQPAAGPNQLPPKANHYYGQPERAQAGQLLVVGLVGYLIGRRRGRIKTEKRLLPVQNKLEKQVKTLTETIAAREQQLIVLKARSERPRSTEKPRIRAERMQPGRSETRLGMEKPERAERLGHLVIAAEAPRRPRNIRSEFRPDEVETMNRSQLLELSEKVVVEGATLRNMYESNLIGERQLRHLVSEHLKGKDIRNELRRSMVEREIDFERDPILRDRVRKQLSTGAGGGGLGQLLADAGLVTADADKQADAKADASVAKAAKDGKSQERHVVSDVAMITAITVLAIAVVVLAWRG